MKNPKTSAAYLYFEILFRLIEVYLQIVRNKRRDITNETNIPSPPILGISPVWIFLLSFESYQLNLWESLISRGVNIVFTNSEKIVIMIKTVILSIR